MSRQHQFPPQPAPRQFKLREFLGVDFTTHESEVNTRRSPDMVNLVSGQMGSMDKRFGFKLEKIYGSKINSMNKISYSYRRYEDVYLYNQSTGLYNLTNRYYDVFKEFIVVHAGEGLYLGRIDSNGNYVHIEQIVSLTTSTGSSQPSISIIGNYPTRLIRLNQFTYMLTGSGTSVIIDFIRGSNVDGAKGSFGLEADATNWTSFNIGYMNETTGFNQESVPTKWAYILDIRYLPMAQSKLKIPITYIAKKPDGTQKTKFESENLLSYFASERFISDGTSTIYKLSNSLVKSASDKDSLGFTLPFYNASTECCLRIRVKDSNGEWVAYGGTYTLTGFRQVNLSVAVPVPTISGEDNVEITYATGIERISAAIIGGTFKKKSVRLLSKLTQFEYFGYNGAFDYAFVQYGWDGDFGKLNIDYRIKLDDDISNIYMDENSYSELGNSDSAIIGYFRYGNELVTLTKKTNGNPTVFMRIASLDEQGEVIFPIRVGVVGVGALSGFSFASLRDDHLWLSEFGISALVTSNIANVQAVQDRSFYINTQLLKEPNLDKAYAFIFDNKYFICINSNIYIADPRIKYNERLSFSESFQYDWYLWNGYNITSHFVSGDTLFLGTSDGNVISYKNNNDARPYQDEIIGTDSAWLDATSYSKGNIVSYLTKYYICLKPHTSDSVMRNPLNSTYWNEIEKGTGVYYVPVLAYWTTPIMNMGDMTSLKTLKNLWVRLGKYAHMSARIYYSTQGVILEKYDGIFDFSDIDFSRFTFSTDTDPSVLVANRQQRKFNSIQFKVESRDSNPFSLLEIVGEFIFNGKYKG